MSERWPGAGWCGGVLRRQLADFHWRFGGRQALLLAILAEWHIALPLCAMACRMGGPGLIVTVVPSCHRAIADNQPRWCGWSAKRCAPPCLDIRPKPGHLISILISAFAGWGWPCSLQGAMFMCGVVITIRRVQKCEMRPAECDLLTK